MIILQHRIYRVDLRSNPDLTYVFGDNEARYGFGGQAGEMRGEPNAHGVATLKAPGQYWTDADFDRQCGVLDADFAPLFEIASSGGSIVLPIDGVGTGLARLRDTAPRTFAYLETLWKTLIESGSK